MSFAVQERAARLERDAAERVADLDKQLDKLTRIEGRLVAKLLALGQSEKAARVKAAKQLRSDMEAQDEVHALRREAGEIGDLQPQASTRLALGFVCNDASFGPNRRMERLTPLPLDRPPRRHP